MYLNHPIQQLVRHKGTRFQLGFANKARSLVPEADEFVLTPSHKGLQVLARNEVALDTPVGMLREAYGPAIEVRSPEVRLLGKQPQEPIMHVRVSLETRHRDAVKAALAKRDVGPLEEYAGTNFCVLRCEAPLAQLLGLPGELSRLTAGRAKHWIVLTHYAVVRGDPGGTAA
jgi:predicted membrane GTPase involved in stress response